MYITTLVPGVAYVINRLPPKKIATAIAACAQIDIGGAVPRFLNFARKEGYSLEQKNCEDAR